MLKAVVTISVMPALDIIVLNNFMIARFVMLSNVGIMLSRKLTGKNIA